MQRIENSENTWNTWSTYCPPTNWIFLNMMTFHSSIAIICHVWWRRLKTTQPERQMDNDKFGIRTVFEIMHTHTKDSGFIHEMQNDRMDSFCISSATWIAVMVAFHHLWYFPHVHAKYLLYQWIEVNKRITFIRFTPEVVRCLVQMICNFTQLFFLPETRS